MTSVSERHIELHGRTKAEYYSVLCEIEDWKNETRLDRIIATVRCNLAVYCYKTARFFDNDLELIDPIGSNSPIKRDLGIGDDV